MNCNYTISIQQSLVLDTYINGIWDRQERPRNFPFRRGEVNNATVYAGTNGFDIYAGGGAFHYHYNYRTDVTLITTVIHGYSGTHRVSVGKVSKLAKKHNVL